MSTDREIAEHFLSEAKREVEPIDAIVDALISIAHALLASLPPEPPEQASEWFNR